MKTKLLVRDFFGSFSPLTSKVSKTKPKKVLICMIYYPDEKGRGGWADAALGAMCYNVAPNRLQAVIRKVFELATHQIQIDGTEVMGIYHALITILTFM